MAKILRSVKNSVASRVSAKRNEVLPYSRYQLPGCLNLDTSPELQLPDLASEFREGFNSFQRETSQLVATGKSATFFKFGDGDYHFLKASPVGSARPGNRALSRPYGEIDHPAFLDGARRCSYYMCELYPTNRRLFAEALPKLSINYWAEYVYAGIATRWFTRQFSGRIGIMGSATKLRLIRDLLAHPLYQDFLGLDDFQDYIEVPDKFACDDLRATAGLVREQLSSAKSELIVLGVGHVKSGLLWQLPGMHEAVYMDIGSGIDALAGIVNRQRPFFGGWANYRLPEKERYEGIDYLQLRDSGNVVRLKRPFSVDDPKFLIGGH